MCSFISVFLFSNRIGRAASVTSRTSRYSGNTATTTAGPKLVQSFVGTHKARKTGKNITTVSIFLCLMFMKDRPIILKSIHNFLLYMFSVTLGILSSSKKQGDTASMPLFELATLCPKEHQVNVRKLKNFLDLNGMLSLAVYLLESLSV